MSDSVRESNSTVAYGNGGSFTPDRRKLKKEEKPKIWLDNYGAG